MGFSGTAVTGKKSLFESVDTTKFNRALRFQRLGRLKNSVTGSYFNFLININLNSIYYLDQTKSLKSKNLV